MNDKVNADNPLANPLQGQGEPVKAAEIKAPEKVSEIEAPPIAQLPDELTLLKAQATRLGLSFSPNIGVDTLRERIRMAMEETSENVQKTEAAAPNQNDVSEKAVDPDDLSQMTPAQVKAAVRSKLIKEEMKLIRIRISNMNPSKSDLDGEFITVSNSFLGTVTKFVPFGEAGAIGWHVPNVIYKNMLDRRFLLSRSKKVRGPNGTQDVVESKWVKEYNIEVLPPLTPQELKQLGNHQAAAQGLGA